MLTAIIAANEILHSNVQDLRFNSSYRVTRIGRNFIAVITYGTETPEELYNDLIKYTNFGNVIIMEPNFHNFASICENEYTVTLEQRVDAALQVMQSEGLSKVANARYLTKPLLSGMKRKIPKSVREVTTNWISTRKAEEKEFIINYYGLNPEELSHYFSATELQQLLTHYNIT